MQKHVLSKFGLIQFDILAAKIDKDNMSRKKITFLLSVEGRHTNSNGGSTVKFFSALMVELFCHQLPIFFFLSFGEQSNLDETQTYSQNFLWS
jgi:hypothetical protein